MSILIPAEAVVKGTYIGYKTVVTKRLDREDGRIMVATHSRGARSGSVEVYEPGSLVRVYNQDPEGDES